MTISLIHSVNNWASADDDAVCIIIIMVVRIEKCDYDPIGIEVIMGQSESEMDYQNIAEQYN